MEGLGVEHSDTAAIVVKVPQNRREHLMECYIAKPIFRYVYIKLKVYPASRVVGLPLSIRVGGDIQVFSKNYPLLSKNLAKRST